MEVFETKDRAAISELSKLTGTNINTIKNICQSWLKIITWQNTAKPAALGIQKVKNRSSVFRNK